MGRWQDALPSQGTNTCSVDSSLTALYSVLEFANDPSRNAIVQGLREDVAGVLAAIRKGDAGAVRKSRDHFLAFARGFFHGTEKDAPQLSVNQVLSVIGTTSQSLPDGSNVFANRPIDEGIAAARDPASAIRVREIRCKSNLECNKLRETAFSGKRRRNDVLTIINHVHGGDPAPRAIASSRGDVPAVHAAVVMRVDLAGEPHFRMRGFVRDKDAGIAVMDYDGIDGVPQIVRVDERGLATGAPVNASGDTIELIVRGSVRQANVKERSERQDENRDPVIVVPVPAVFGSFPDNSCAATASTRPRTPSIPSFILSKCTSQYVDSRGKCRSIRITIDDDGGAKHHAWISHPPIAPLSSIPSVNAVMFDMEAIEFAETAMDEGGRLLASFFRAIHSLPGDHPSPRILSVITDHIVYGEHAMRDPIIANSEYSVVCMSATIGDYGFEISIAPTPIHDVVAVADRAGFPSLFSAKVINEPILMQSSPDLPPGNGPRAGMASVYAHHEKLARVWKEYAIWLLARSRSPPTARSIKGTSPPEELLDAVTEIVSSDAISQIVSRISEGSDIQPVFRSMRNVRLLMRRRGGLALRVTEGIRDVLRQWVWERLLDDPSILQKYTSEDMITIPGVFLQPRDFDTGWEVMNEERALQLVRAPDAGCIPNLSPRVRTELVDEKCMYWWSPPSRAKSSRPIYLVQRHESRTNAENALLVWNELRVNISAIADVDSSNASAIRKRINDAILDAKRARSRRWATPSSAGMDVRDDDVFVTDGTKLRPGRGTLPDANLIAKLGGDGVFALLLQNSSET